MGTAVFIILTLHSFAAIITFIRSMRQGEGLGMSLRWGLIGLLTGLIGLVSRSRMSRQRIVYMHVLQDALLNLALEIVAILVAYLLMR